MLILSGDPAVYNLFINFIHFLLAYCITMWYFIIAKGNKGRTEGRREGQVTAGQVAGRQQEASKQKAIWSRTEGHWEG